MLNILKSFKIVFLLNYIFLWMQRYQPLSSFSNWSFEDKFYLLFSMLLHF
jgi:hypothetical protein